MQPPDTEPTARPSPRRASMAPLGRGLEPKVSTTVTSHSGSSFRLPLVQRFQDGNIDAIHGISLSRSGILHYETGVQKLPAIRVREIGPNPKNNFLEQRAR